MHITFVSWNTKKFTEISSALDSSITLFQENVDLLEPQILDLWEISAHKAKQAFELLQKPVLVDDTGTFFESYKHFPGVFTKFVYQQLGFEGMQKLLSENNNSKFVTILSYMDETLDVPLQFIGEISWTITFDFHHLQEVDHHMPYNSIFCPDWRSHPICLSYDTWTQDNQRVRAAKKFSEWILSRKG